MLLARLLIMLGLIGATADASVSLPLLPAAMVTIDPLHVSAGPEMPIRATFPAKALGRLPLIILSHGNRLSRSDYRPLVEYWARAGFMVLQPDHSDASVDGLPPSTPQPPDAWRRRIVDIEHILNGLGEIENQSGRSIDRARIAVAGHSFGGHTAEALVGVRITDPTTRNLTGFGDPRVKAAILLAPPGGAAGLVPEWRARAPYLEVDFTTMQGPMLLVAGSEDSDAMSAQGPEWRTEAYREAPAGGKCMLVIAGAGHYLGGINGPFQPPVDVTQDRLDLVRSATVTFLRSALNSRNTSWQEFRAARPNGITCK